MEFEREQNKFADIIPENYDYVWFDFPCNERALIKKQEEQYILSVHEYDELAGKWEIISQNDVFDR